MSNPKTYTAPHPVYVDNKMYQPGEPFTTASPKGKAWEHADAKEAAAAEAAAKGTHADANIDELGLPALQALAATKNVAITAAGKRLNKDELVAAIKAADEPAL